MKTHRKPLAPGQNKLKSRRGVALITVLTIISLCTILVLTFFQLAQNEMVSSDSYNNGLEAQQIAEEAVNLVIRQIREATANEESKNGIGWASQPGAIRTWNDRGKFHKGYKLYSDDTMVVSESEKDLVEADFSEVQNWDAKPWQFVDLNEPVIRGEKVYYPIVDPAARNYPKWKTPLGKDKDGIEGFDYNLAAVAAGPMESAVKALKGPDGIANREPLPMPVKWIYQLEDGTLGVLNDSKKFVAVSGGSTPTEANPIVARFAFWADDETCKSNPNTHAGGAAWGTPVASGMVDREGFARYQPTQHEWQRYPGHPATTHMATVLAPGIPDITYNRDAMEILFGLIPRVVGGGSMSGTRKVDMNDPREKNGLIADKDRLYASLDEFLLEPGLRRSRPTRSDQIREPNDFPDPSQRSGSVMDAKDVQDHLERAKFFLSVASRAPETTVFNTPRISIWPTRFSDSPSFEREHHQTPFDQLIRFCAEVGRDKSTGKRFKYHFERINADSATQDLPSAGSANGVSRNSDLLFYLDKLTRTPIPGVGKSFSQKYQDNERRQILTEIFDYIRSTNLHDDSLYGDNWRDAFKKDNVADPYTYTNPRKISGSDRGVHKGHGQVTPIQFDWGSGVKTKGLGRFTTLYEVGMHVICCADGGDGTKGGYELRFSYPGMMKYRATDSWEWLNPPELPEVPAAPRPRLHYSNFPPMPMEVDVDQEKYINLDGTPQYSVPYATKRAAWNQWPTWLRKMAEPQYLRDPATAGTGADNQNPEYDAAQYAPDLVFYAFDPKRWNWQLAWLDTDYANKIEELFSDKNAGNNVTGGVNARYDRNWLSMDAWRGKPADGVDPAVEPTTRLGRNERLVQAGLLLQGFCPSLGWVPINPDMEMDITIKSPFEFEGAQGRNGRLPDSIGQKLAEGDMYRWSSNLIERASHHDRHYGGTRAWTYFLRASSNMETDNSTGLFDTGLNSADAFSNINFGGRPSPIDRHYEAAKQFNRYPFIARPWKIAPADPSQAPVLKLMNDVDLVFDIYSAGNDSETQGTAATVERQHVQTINVEFKKFDAPAPILVEGDPGYVNEFGKVERGPIAPLHYWSLSWDGINPHVSSRGRLSFGDTHRLLAVRGNYDNANKRWIEADVLKSVGIGHGDARLVVAMPEVPKGVFLPRPGYEDANAHFAHTFMTTPGGSLPYASKDPAVTVSPTPVERQLIPDTKVVYAPRPLGTGSLAAKDWQWFGDFDNGFGNTIDGPYINKPDEGNTHSLFNRTDPGAIPNGAFEMARDYGDYPYFVRDWIHEPGTPAYFSPNRIISSPVQFGSLPVGVFADADGRTNRPWRTLLFRPDVGFNPAVAGTATSAGSSGGKTVNHPGALTPADHYLLDLFWMPVVEPYAISEPLSTGGKVNLNYQILPFRHITRNSAIRAVFKSEYMLCVPNKWGRDYKNGVGRGRGYHWRDAPFGGSLQNKSLRTIILEDETLAQFERKFDVDGTIFRSASEICDIHLIPQEVSKRTQQGGATASIDTYTPSLSDMESGKYWADHAVVGDNSRERPYSNIYPRVCTKSNTFKVHYRAQVLRKAKGTEPSQWDPLSDQVVAEYRGSSVVERYVDPNDSDIPDYVELLKDDSSSSIDAPTIDEFYKYRVIQPTRFAP